jgi:hypothetical protein
MSQTIQGNAVVHASADAASCHAKFETDGFYLAGAMLPADLVQRAVAAMDDVMECKYETGVPPVWRSWNPGGSPTALRKIDDSHCSSNAIYNLVTHGGLGQVAAKLMDARMIQVWATQLLYKPPVHGVGDSIQWQKQEGPKHWDKGNIGWHQDRQYWKFWEGEVFTAWIALSDVTAASGPMKFVRGSNAWGELDWKALGESGEDPRVKLQLKGNSWEEVEAILPPGGVSFHHRFTVHGSGANASPLPRRAIAVHMRTEKSRPVEGATDYYTKHLDDQRLRPVIFRQ